MSVVEVSPHARFKACAERHGLGLHRIHVLAARKTGSFQSTLVLDCACGLRWLLRVADGDVISVDRAMLQALRREREALEQACERGARFAETCHWIGLGHDHALAAELEPARAALARARAALAERPPAFPTQLDSAELWLLQAEGCAQRLAGDTAAARITAEQQLAAATSVGIPKHLALAHLALARAEVLEQRWAAAKEQLDLSMDILQRRPAPLVGWRVLAELGRVEAALGNEPAARQHAVAAREGVERIAEGVAEPELREGFLGSADVRALSGLLPCALHPKQHRDVHEIEAGYQTVGAPNA